MSSENPSPSQETDENQFLTEIILKTVGILTLFGLSIVMGILPLKLEAFQTNLRITGMANALSAGIFLSVSLLHLLPEAHEDFQSHLESKFPFAFLIAILSYTLILIIEKLAFDTHKWLEIHVHPDLHHHEHKKSVKQEASTFLISINEKKENYDCCGEKGEEKMKEQNHKNECDTLMQACSHDEVLLANKQIPIPSPIIEINLSVQTHLNKSMHNENQDNLISIPNDGKGKLEDQLILKKAKSSSFSEINKRETQKKELNKHKQSLKDLDFDESNFKDLLNVKSNVARTISYHDKHRTKHELKQKRLDEEGKKGVFIPSEIPEPKHQTRHIGKLTPYVLLIALSFHGIFEGIAIGLQRETSQLANLLLAVALHKWAEALTLGMSFNKNESRNDLSIRMIIIFSSTGPLGIGMGWALSKASGIVSAIFMSISAGTFLYVSASEVVVEEFSISKNKWLKLLFFIIGVIIISGLWFLEND